MSDFKNLKEEILADGVIDADEVKQLEKALYADGEIDQDEAELMFELNDAVSGKENHESWDQLFIKSICDFLLNDAESPGKIDAEETEWLKKHLIGDGKIDLLEMKLLKTLKEKATSFPESLLKYIQ